jgi:predicted MFS family arabinose efflux permease
MLLSTALDFICLMLMKNPSKQGERTAPVKPLMQVLRMLLTNKSFVYVVILGALLYTATYMTLGFMGIYKTKDLLLTVGAVQLINIAGCLARFFLTKPIARYADRHSYVKGVKLGLWIALVGFVVNIFTTPHTWWAVILFTLIYHVSCAGTGQNMYNIVFSYVEEDYFVQASALKNSVSGLCGFGASVLGGVILDAVQKNGNQIFGVPVYGQQLLSGISALILLIAIAFVSRALEKRQIVAK